MIKSSNIKSEFERLIQEHFVSHPFGKSSVLRYEIKIANATKNTYVYLWAQISSCFGVCVARSYPMSYKSAYRLVCSL